ncbi:hypothetical protein [Mesorhizobium sp. 131-3-5]|uniref:hypothetical protein n=1 Tax=Mesorhizobium sp. 131-3-5 TaxID=2744520 RepID=UPI00406C0D3E
MKRSEIDEEGESLYRTILDAILQSPARKSSSSAGLEADGPSDRVPVHSRTAGEDLRTCQSPDVWIRLATRIQSLVVNSPLLAAKSQKKAPRQKRRMENRISAF